ncbi:phosphoglycerate mutase [Pollutimonas nitritireducens]|uniref:Phosphoglycerate mutase n=1 Tax=Pollutimonas nitritireducens TaxID=2045209 RepID=A0A2N4UK12_9BURK|nr:histidine phosphatase family protein [Pollutimonas nitritireducens]PLC55361.1 phosphoglycerate mutase [Pollutimonas nitritireducens]
MNGTQFWLVRHGETEWNANRRLQGWLDIPLSAVGVRQAEQLAEYLQSPAFDVSIDAIASSDLSRAFETARIAAGHLGLQVRASRDLRERCYGIYEGRDWTALDALRAGQGGVDFRDPQQAVEKGESLHAFSVRISGAFEALAQQYKGQRVLVFSHGGVIDIAWRKTHGISLGAARPDPILNTSINHFSIDEANNWAMIDWGRIGHLETSALDDVL